MKKKLANIQNLTLNSSFDVLSKWQTIFTAQPQITLKLMQLLLVARQFTNQPNQSIEALPKHII